MRKQNSEFLTAFTSEASNDIQNTDYFGFVELDDTACYVIADGIDDQLEARCAKLAVNAAVAAFLEAPSIGKRTVKRCLDAANRALIEAKSKTKWKASVLIVLTDYVKLRYGQAGNIRLRLYRNGFIRHQTQDQSLTMELVKEEKLTQDKVAAHEERNNLYAYLGQEKGFHPYISKKLKLNNADVAALYTRGIWEHIDEGELRDVFAEASDKPEESVDAIEDLLLSRQPDDLQKYTMAVVFINKIFTDPNKKRKIRKILMITAIVLVILTILTVLLILLHNRREDKKEQMMSGYTDTIEYIQMDNYVRAQARCGDAMELADGLKDRRMEQELGNYSKLIEAVLAAEEQMDAGKYTEAQASYQEAAKRARYVDNLGLDYINGRLAETADYITVYDLIYMGDVLTRNLQYDKAEEKYLEAKAIAARNYFDEGRTASMDALEKLYDKQKEEKEAEQEQQRAQLEQEESGVNYIAQGDAAFTQGDYESAKVYYSSALQKYGQLKDEAQQEALEEKIRITQEKLAAGEELAEEAQGYMDQAAASMEAGDYTGAKKYYLLAKDVYASLKADDKISEIARRLELMEMKEQEAEEAAAEEQALPPAVPEEQAQQAPAAQ